MMLNTFSNNFNDFCHNFVSFYTFSNWDVYRALEVMDFLLFIGRNLDWIFSMLFCTVTKIFRKKNIPWVKKVKPFANNFNDISRNFMTFWWKSVKNIMFENSLKAFIVKLKWKLIKINIEKENHLKHEIRQEFHEIFEHKVVIINWKVMKIPK